MKTRLLSLIASLALTAVSVHAQEERSTEKYNPSNVTLAIQGWDPVSFFSEEGPIEGSPNIKETYEGVNYQFSSEENKATFLANPNKYESTYGGWCAWAMVDGGTVPIDPKYYGFDFNDQGEKIRIHFFVAQRALENFYNRRSVRRKSSAEIAKLMQEEILNGNLNGAITSTARGFQSSADAQWKAFSNEDPRLSNGKN